MNKPFRLKRPRALCDLKGYELAPSRGLQVRDASNYEVNEAKKAGSMLVFMDESGDAGLKIAQGSSSHFVVVLVVFNDSEEAQAVDQRLGMLRRELRLHPNFEFKFNKCQASLRLAFLKAAAAGDFFYYGIVVNKSELYGEGFRVKESFYKYVTQLVFLNAREHLEGARVYIDATGDRVFRRQVDGYLKRKVNLRRRHIERVAFLDSASSNLIQLADMIAGAIRRSYSGKPDSDEYVRVIRHRQAGLHIWPTPKK